MAIGPTSLARTIAADAGMFVSVLRRTVLLSERITKAADTIDKQSEQIKQLINQVRALQADNAVMAAKLESIALRAVTDVTGELSRRVGYLEGRASRD